MTYPSASIRGSLTYADIFHSLNEGKVFLLSRRLSSKEVMIFTFFFLGNCYQTTNMDITKLLLSFLPVWRSYTRREVH